MLTFFLFIYLLDIHLSTLHSRGSSAKPSLKEIFQLFLRGGKVQGRHREEDLSPSEVIVK